MSQKRELFLVCNKCNTVGLFSNNKKKEFCTVCKKGISRKSNPKKNWNVKGPLCANCYVDLMKENFEKKKDNDNKCVLCGSEPGTLNLWKPKKEWGIKGWLCEPCLNEREKADNELKKKCSMCDAKLGFFVRRPKQEWGVAGYLCKNCWNLQESQTSEENHG
jgi:hypothetical protein